MVIGTDDTISLGEINHTEREIIRGESWEFLQRSLRGAVEFGAKFGIRRQRTEFFQVGEHGYRGGGH